MSAIGLGILIKILIVVSGAAAGGVVELLNSRLPQLKLPNKIQDICWFLFFEEINLQFAFVGIHDIMINCTLNSMDVSKIFSLKIHQPTFFHRRTSSRSEYHNHAGPPARVDEDITGMFWRIFVDQNWGKTTDLSYYFKIFKTPISKVEIHQKFTSHLGPTKSTASASTSYASKGKVLRSAQSFKGGS